MSTVIHAPLVPNYYNPVSEESTRHAFSLTLTLKGSIARRSNDDPFITSTSLKVSSLGEIIFFKKEGESSEKTHMFIPLSELKQGEQTFQLKSSRPEIMNHMTFLLFNNEDVDDEEKALRTHNVVELMPALVNGLTCTIEICPVGKAFKVEEHPSQISLGGRFKNTVDSENSKEENYTDPEIIFSVEKKIKENKEAVERREQEEKQRLEEKERKKRELIKEAKLNVSSVSYLHSQSAQPDPALLDNRSSNMYCCNIL